MKLRRFIALLAVWVLLCGMLPLSVTAAVDKQPLKNGDFEEGTMQYWRFANSVSVSPVAAYDGAYGCLITSDGGWGDLLSQTFSVLPGYSYTLSFWYKADPMGVSWYLFDGDQDGVRLQRGWAGNTDWTCVSTTFTATEDTVLLLYRSSGSHVAERVYLDCVAVTLNPCAVHTYDHDCDRVCNICDEVREVGDHVYSYACDAVCNICGYQRLSIGDHVYDYPCATLCHYCGEERNSTNPHTYTNVCDADCDCCGEVREPEHAYDHLCDTDCGLCDAVREVSHFYDDTCDDECNECGYLRRVEHLYDDSLDLDCNLCAHTRVAADLLSATGVAISYDVNGISFRFALETDGTQINPDNSYVTRSALVQRYLDESGFQLVRMGAVMSNKKGSALNLESVDNNKVIDVKASYLCKVTQDRLTFAVRIINIPAQGHNTSIFARPYYVYSDGQTDIVVYGETVTQTFNGVANAAA